MRIAEKRPVGPPSQSGLPDFVLLRSWNCLFLSEESGDFLVVAFLAAPANDCYLPAQQHTEEGASLSP